MNSRERILAAINCEPVDRIPTDMWATAEVRRKLTDYFGEGVSLWKELHIDGMGYVFPRYAGPAPPAAPEGESVDFWGVRTKRVPHEGGAYDEVSFCPLASVQTLDDLDAYAWPQADWFDYSHMRERAERVRKTRVVNCGAMMPFFHHNALRGLEQSLLDPLVEPELTHEILKRLTDFFYEQYFRIFETCEGLIDLAGVTDDLGSQVGPLMSLDVYREFYAPHHKRLIDLCHEFGVKVFHHDDGGIRPFIPILVDMGIDVLNPIQWACRDMDMKELKSKFGGKICFHGAIENQKILPFGTPEDVREEVRHCIDSLASDGTGYILASCHNIQVNTPVENIIAMYDEAWHYGKMA
ncbi:MAG: uroporphyrinogen decarboxylase family protein [Candidatus Hydrogenedentes bacterium]|nr:uroporphyrinogen decarboxylase family protein [Candidatus Hydrogenedentota bacterium]